MKRDFIDQDKFFEKCDAGYFPHMQVTVIRDIDMSGINVPVINLYDMDRIILNNEQIIDSITEKIQTARAWEYGSLLTPFILGMNDVNTDDPDIPAGQSQHREIVCMQYCSCIRRPISSMCSEYQMGSPEWEKGIRQIQHDNAEIFKEYVQNIQAYYPLPFSAPYVALVQFTGGTCIQPETLFNGSVGRSTSGKAEAVSRLMKTVIDTEEHKSTLSKWYVVMDDELKHGTLIPDVVTVASFDEMYKIIEDGIVVPET